MYPSQCTVSGIIRGAAKQKIGAVSLLVFCYFVGFPISMSLLFATKLGIYGEDNMKIIGHI